MQLILRLDQILDKKLELTKLKNDDIFLISIF